MTKKEQKAIAPWGCLSKASYIGSISRGKKSSSSLATALGDPWFMYDFITLFLSCGLSSSGLRPLLSSAFHSVSSPLLGTISTREQWTREGGRVKRGVVCW